jgi:hypothetical protein
LFIARIFRRDRLHRFNLRQVCDLLQFHRDLLRRRNNANAQSSYTKKLSASRANGCAKSIIPGKFPDRLKEAFSSRS